MYVFTGSSVYLLGAGGTPNPLCRCVAVRVYVRAFVSTATHCNTLQHTAAHHSTQCKTLIRWKTQKSTPWKCARVTHCNTLQHTATHTAERQVVRRLRRVWLGNVLSSNTLQHAATHCNTLQHTLCNTLQHTATHTATHYLGERHKRKRTPWKGAQVTRCNTPQHTATQTEKY